MNRVETARKLFLSGYNCAQAVLCAFGDVTGLEPSAAFALASSLGGGMGGLREVCGACSASYLAAGLVYGPRVVGDTAKKAHYQRIQQLAEGFTQRHGTLICRELLDKHGAAYSAVPLPRTPDYYRERPCLRYVEDAVALLEQLLDKPLWLVETDRLRFRHLTPADHEALRPILGDPQTMHAWEYGFSDQQIDQWIARNMVRYSQDGCGYCAAISKETSQLIGLMGLLLEEVDGQSHWGLGYILGRQHWGHGYAAEGGTAWLDYARNSLGAQQVVATIRPENAASCRVAERLGMEVVSQFIKHHQGREMPHLVYSITV